MTTYTSSNYSRIMKFDKSSYHEIKRDIFQLVHESGTGRTDPVPYDTAWVARIPGMRNPLEPAFPECLQWLRNNQKQDGSWGTDIPLSLDSKTLNTFASVLALSQWNYSEDKGRQQRGLNALTRLAKSLPLKETNDIIFEMILTGFLDDARELKVEIPYEHFDWFYQIGKKAQGKIEHQVMSDKPNKYWAFLEASCRSLELEIECFRSEITQFGLIAAQPSTTAYVLRYARLNGKDLPEAEWALEKLCAENKGGVPHITPCDNFEIVHVLDFLFKAGINPQINTKHAVAKIALKTLKERLGCQNGIGISSNWPIDDECLKKIALNVMQYSKVQQVNEIRNGTAAKLNDLESTLGTIKSNYLQKILTNNEAYSFVDDAYLIDRNVSLYYNILQEVFKSPEAETIREIMHFLGNNQNDDGGWGSQGNSTVEETAYVGLTLFGLLQTNSEALKHVNFTKAVNFMDNVKSENFESFWCFKVNFNPVVVSKAVVAVAKYVLLEIQRLLLMTAAFNDNQLEFLGLDICEKDGKNLFHGNMLLTYPEIQQQEMEVNKQEVMHICKRILEVESFDSHMQAFVDIGLDLSYWTLSNKISPYDRAIATLQMVAIFIGDDVYDFYLLGKNGFLKESNELLNVWCKILRGDYTTFESIPAVKFPRFSFLAKWLLHFRKLIEKNGWNAESFIKIIGNGVLNSFALCYKLKRYGIELTPKRYLEIAKRDCTLAESAHLNVLLDTNTLDMANFENYKLFVKYVDCACKAARILTDVPSALKDLNESKLENYCIQLQNEYKISLREAMVKAAKKGNKEVLKMYCFKKVILQDPVCKSNSMLLCMKYVENCLDGIINWGLNTPRYKVGWKFFTKRVPYGEKDSKFIWDTCFN